MELSHGALIHFPTDHAPAADLTITLTRPELVQLLLVNNSAGINFDGDATVLTTLVGLLDTADPSFAVVTP